MSGAEIVDGPFELMSKGGMRRFSYRIRCDTDAHNVVVAIPDALMESPPRHRVAARMVETKGRAGLEHTLAQGRVPRGLVTIQYAEHEFGEEAT